MAECRFTFTPAEMRRAARLHRKANRRGALIALGLAWLVLGSIFVWTVADGVQTGQSLGLAIFYSLPTPLILLFLTLIFTPLQGYLVSWIFRRNPLYNREVIYLVDEEGVEMQSASFRQRADWPMFGKMREGREGFVLYWGRSSRSFHWLPKSGFASPAEIDECRALIRKHVADFRNLDPA